ncbi:MULTISPECIES: HNH endonuclease family protein [Chelativorans]|uniref:HNH endonuclease family protein n=1 Tax=Chelativorans TaxID=449972 RepID=UPI00140BB78B|nr:MULTISPECIES: HNH endonuclease family protein [Chelativorans]
MLDEFLAGCFPELASLPLSAGDVAGVVAKVKKLHEEIHLLVKLQGGEWPFSSSTKVTAWDRSRLGLLINELKHTNCMPLLLAATQLAEKDFADVVQMLERFMFRYKVISDAHIGAATSVYHEQAVAIRKAPAAYKIANLRKKLQALLDKSANDAVFKSRLQGMMYERELTNKPLKYLLITLESYLRWYRDGAKGAPRCLDKMVVFDPSATTVEHVYPEKASAADASLDPLLDTLGNLTLLGSTDNDAAGNKPFAKKKAIFEKSLVGLNQEIAKNAAWTAAVVEARQTDLEQVALKVFRMTP